MNFLVNNKNISLSLYGLLFIYQMIGVAIHKQYGFGFFYWPVQEFLLLLLSLIVILGNFERFKEWFLKVGFFYHIYVLIVCIILLGYIFFVDKQSISYLSTNELYEIFFETIIWYTISLALAFTLKDLLNKLNLKILTILTIFISSIFFAYIIKLNLNLGGDVSRAFFIGANFPTKEIDIFLSKSGYVKGFHLYFSPLFAVFSTFIVYFLKKENKKLLLIIYIIFSVYILFLASGRGSLLSYLAAIFLVFSSFKTKIILSSIFVFAIIPLGSFLEESNPRFYKLITLNFADDPSSVGRLHDLLINYELIKTYFFEGGLRSYLELNAAYIHSAISILQEYGIIVFIIFLVMIVHSLLKLYSLKNTDEYYLYAPWLIFIIFDMLLFKYIHETQTMILFSIVYLSILTHTKKVQNVI